MKKSNLLHSELTFWSLHAASMGTLCTPYLYIQLFIKFWEVFRHYCRCSFLMFHARKHFRGCICSKTCPIYKVPASINGVPSPADMETILHIIQWKQADIILLVFKGTEGIWRSAGEMRNSYNEKFIAASLNFFVSLFYYKSLWQKFRKLSFKHVHLWPVTSYSATGSFKMGSNWSLRQ